METKNVDLQSLQLNSLIEINPSNGSISGSVNVPLPEGRNGYNPQLSLSYSSSSGNSIFGAGWNLNGLSFIKIDTTNGLAKYEGTDNYSLNGTVALIPQLVLKDGKWIKKINNIDNYWVYYYRAKEEGEFLRIEKWVDIDEGDIHWRIRDKNNNLSIYGLNDENETKILDPENKDRVFKWLLEKQFDNLGNAVFYEYKIEDANNINQLLSYEKNRINSFLKNGFSQRYLKSILYGNSIPLLPDKPIPNNNKWHYELILDYGEYEHRPYTSNHKPINKFWSARLDPFSSYHAGFEIRTYRLCKRFLIYRHLDNKADSKGSLTGVFECVYNERELGTLLEGIKYTGIRKDLNMGNYSESQLPELKFSYTQHEVGTTVKGLVNETAENIPYGLNDVKTRFVDLFGEGLPGILTESASTWYYKPNMGGGKFGKQEVVINKPSHELGIYSLGDFDQDGNLNVYSLQGRLAGHYDYDRDKECWSGFKPMKTIPQSSHAKFLDLDADGFPELVIELDDKLICYPFKGKKGFEEPYEYIKPRNNGISYAPMIGDNTMLGYLMADMTGDGLSDQVSIRNGKVEYFPNLGNGKFGKAILMEDSPLMDFESTFDANRIKLYDLTGSGTSDIIYIGNGAIRFWYNASGNRFIEGGIIKGLPYIDNIHSATILDLLGNNSPCLVWTNLSGFTQDTRVQFIELKNGVNSNLLVSMENGMGKEIKIKYGFSGNHYLEAKRNGDPWITKIPHHFVVAEKQIILDHITNMKLVTVFKYRDGHYDGNERSFVTFGLTEQYDSELLQDSSNPLADTYTQPSCTKTWYHSGIFGTDAMQQSQYYKRDSQHQVLTPYNFELVQALDESDFEQALRALAGRVVRQEIFGSSPEGKVNEHPFKVFQNSYTIRNIQPKTESNVSSFFVFQTEGLEHIYSEKSTDPKVSHKLIISTDTYGNVEKEIDVSYKRRPENGEQLVAQTKDYILLSKNEYVNIEATDNYQVGVLFQTREYEINRLEYSTGRLVQIKNISNTIDNLIEEAVDHDQSIDATNNRTVLRLLSWNCIYYWDSDLTGVLPLGEIGDSALIHHYENACFTPNMLSSVYEGKVTEAIFDEGNYILKNNYWWQTSETISYFGLTGFFSVKSKQRDTAYISTFKYDDSFLHVIKNIDAKQNTTEAKIDYNVGAIYQLTDVNGTITEVLYDALGVPVLTFNQGTVFDENNVSQKYGSDMLGDYEMNENKTFANLISDSSLYIQNAESIFYYDLNSWKDNRKALKSIHLIRKNLVYDGCGNTDDKGVADITIEYQDGFGRVIQSKQKVDSGLALSRKDDGTIEIDDKGEFVSEYTEERWLVTGHVVYNNKQQPIKHYEPFFSTQYEFESNEQFESYGISIVNRYDAIGQLVRADYPNNTFTELEITPWRISHFDQNDTVERSLYKVFREMLPESNPERMALDRSLAHKNTPSESILDPLGREIVDLKQNNNGLDNRIEKHYNANGSIVEVIDSRNLIAFEYKYDMLGRVLYEKSIDSGENWNFHNNYDLIIHAWNSRNVHRRIEYDILDRPLTVFVDGALGLDQITERFVYGDDPSVTNAKERNLINQLVIHYDQAGKRELKQVTPGGNLLHEERSLLSDFKQEPDWTNPETILFDETVYTTKYYYDGVNRLVKMELPDGTVRDISLNARGGVQKITVTSADGTLNEVPVMKDTVYDAKGLRQNVVLGNDVKINYEYDSETFRLKRLRAKATDGTTKNYQDIHYTYDPVGNLIHYVDESQQPSSTITGALKGLNVSSHSEFEYDALYQLTSAKGRVHQALLQHDFQSSNSSNSDKLKGTRHITLNNAESIERYKRTYSYDESGNLKETKHKGVSQAWTSKYWVDSNSNRSLPLSDHNGIEINDPQNNFDANGNCISLSHLRKIEWNYRNNISRTVIIDRSSEGNPNDEEFYVYDGNGLRIRKVTQRLLDVQSGQIELTDKIYLDGCEIKRVTIGETEALIRVTSHISDGVNTIALIHSWQKDLHNRETDDIQIKKIHYQLQNHLGSSALELDENGNVITYEEYFPYGGTSFIAGKSKREINLKDYRYSGKEMDNFSGLYYYGYRYYAHWSGGWLSPDPIGPADGVNLYLFVRNNPVNIIDPNGLQGNSLNIIGEVDPSLSKEEAKSYLNKNYAFQRGFRVLDMKVEENDEGEDYWLITDYRELTEREIDKINEIEEKWAEDNPEFAEELIELSGALQDTLSKMGVTDSAQDVEGGDSKESACIVENEESPNNEAVAESETGDSISNDKLQDEEVKNVDDQALAINKTSQNDNRETGKPIDLPTIGTVVDNTLKTTGIGLEVNQTWQESVIKRTEKAIEKNRKIIDNAKNKIDDLENALKDKESATKKLINAEERLLEGESKIKELQESEKPKSRSQRRAHQTNEKKLNRFIENAKRDISSSKNTIDKSTKFSKRLDVRYWHGTFKNKLPELLKNKELLEGIKQGSEKTLKGVKVAGKILGPIGTILSIKKLYDAVKSENTGEIVQAGADLAVDFIGYMTNPFILTFTLSYNAGQLADSAFGISDSMARGLSSWKVSRDFGKRLVGVD